jgi:hypothetical protein
MRYGPRVFKEASKHLKQRTIHFRKILHCTNWRRPRRAQKGPNILRLNNTEQNTAKKLTCADVITFSWDTLYATGCQKLKKPTLYSNSVFYPLPNAYSGNCTSCARTRIYMYSVRGSHVVASSTCKGFASEENEILTLSRTNPCVWNAENLWSSRMLCSVEINATVSSGQLQRRHNVFIMYGAIHVLCGWSEFHPFVFCAGMNNAPHFKPCMRSWVDTLLLIYLWISCDNQIKC